MKSIQWLSKITRLTASLPCRISDQTAGVIPIRRNWARMIAWMLLCSPGWASAGERITVNNEQPAQMVTDPAPMQVVELLDMASVLPQGWEARPLGSKMRLAQFEVPGDKMAEMVVFYFGPGQGGSPEANIARWTGQFRPVSGRVVQPVVSTLQNHGGFAVTWVEIKGDYARGVGMGPVGEYKPDQMLIAAITQTPQGNLYIQFHGDRGKILEHRDEFKQFVMALWKTPAL